MTYFKKILSLVLVAGAASACSSDIDDDVTPEEPGEGSTAGGEDTTFDHDNTGKSPFEVLAEQQENGPYRYTAVVHKCSKIPYAVLGNILRSRGIVFPGAANSAGGLYTSGAGQIGAPNFAVLLRENSLLTTSGVGRTMDIWAAGATEIIAGFANIEACKINGTSPPLFDAGGTKCNAAAFTCLAGAPLSPAHLDICEKTIAGAKNAAGNPDQAIGQRLAVAVMLAAAHMCD
jgi:hypothetical protein